MPEGKGYGSTPSIKPTHGDYGGGFNSTPSSNAGNSGRKIKSGPFPADDTSRSGGKSRYRNTTNPGDPGSKGY